MVETHDIDALLIGALYGELTPADEARLSAHLESHPADRSALEDLTRARAAVRDSQIFAVQLDPPQAVSALLLQEAARRAPKRVTRRDGSTETEGWFARFIRTFASHPGVAAAAMLVVVVGVAGTMYLRKGDPFVEPAAPTVASQHETTAYKAAPADQAAPAGRAAESADPEGTTKDVASTTATTEQANKLDGDKVQLGQAGSATAYDVKLEKSLDRLRGAKGEAIAAGPKGSGQKDAPADFGAVGGSTGGDFYRNGAPAPAHAAAKPARALEVGHRDPSPKELADNDESSDGSVAKADAPATRDAQQQRPAAGKAADLDANAQFAKSGMKYSEEKPAVPAPVVAMPRTSANTIASATPPPAAPPPPPAATSPAATPPKSAPSKTADKPETKTVAKNEPGAGGAPAQTPRADDSKEATKKKSPDDARSPDAKKPAPADDQLVAWAKSRHAAAQGLAKDGKCQDVGTIIADLAQRAPDYYNQFVATDRSLKQCQAYIAAEREKNADKASKSRAKAAAPAANEDMH